MALLYPRNGYLHTKFFNTGELEERYKMDTGTNIIQDRKYLDKRLRMIAQHINNVPSVPVQTCSPFRQKLYNLNHNYEEDILGYKNKKEIGPPGDKSMAYEMIAALNNEYRLNICIVEYPLTKLAFPSLLHTQYISNDVIMIEKLIEYRLFKISRHRERVYKLLLKNINNLFKSNILITKWFTGPGYPAGEESIPSLKNIYDGRINTEVFVNMINNIENEKYKKYDEYKELKKTIKTYKPTKLFLHAIIYTCEEKHTCALIRCGQNFYYYDGLKYNNGESWIKQTQTDVQNKLKYMFTKAPMEIIYIYWNDDSMFVP